MAKQNFVLPQNFSCRSCDANVSNTADVQWKQTTLENQVFFSTKCQLCNQMIYFWQNKQNNNFYYINKVNIVLYEPEIPGNVGAIIRLACAFDFTVHLIEPFGFIYSEKWLGRASAGHFQLNKQKLYSSWNEFIEKNKDGKFILTSSHAQKYVHDFDFRQITNPIYIVFGRESRGLPHEITSNPQHINLKIAQTTLASSINLAQAVSIFSFFLRSQYGNFEFF